MAQITDPAIIAQLNAQLGEGTAKGAGGLAPMSATAPAASAPENAANPRPPAITDPATLQYLNAQRGQVPGTVSPPQAKEQSVLPALGSAVLQSMSSKILGAPVDLQEMIIKEAHKHGMLTSLKLGEVKDKSGTTIGGSEWWRKTLHIPDVPIPLDSTGHVSTANEYLVNMASFAAGALVFGAGDIAKAKGAVELAPKALEGVQKVASDVMESVAKKAEETIPETAPKLKIPEAVSATASKAAKIAKNTKAMASSDLAKKIGTAAAIAGGGALAGAGSTEGEQWGRDLAPHFGLSSEEGAYIGSFAGSMFGPFLFTELSAKIDEKASQMSNVAREKLRQMGKNRGSQRAAINATVAKELQDHIKADPHSLQTLSDTIDTISKMPDLKPNLIQMFGAPGLHAEGRAAAGSNPTAHMMAARTDVLHQQAIQDFTEKSFGPSTAQVPSGAAQGKAANILDPARLTQQNLRKVNDLHLDELQRERTALDEAFKEAVDPSAIGAQLRQLYWDKRLEVKRGLDQQMQGKGGVYDTARKMGVTADMTDIRDLVKRIATDDPNVFQDMPTTFGKIARQYPEGTPDTFVRKEVTPQGAIKPVYRTEVKKGSPGKNTASFEELHSLSKETNREWVDAIAARNDQKARYLSMVKDALGEKLQQFTGEEYGQLGQQLRDFNSQYQKYANTFKEGLGGQLAKRTKAGIVVDDSEIVKKIVGSGDSKKGIEDFMQLYGHSPEAGELLHNGLLDLFSRAAVKDGVFDPGAAQRWLDGHKLLLRELPETSKYFSDAANVGKDLKLRQLQLQKERAAIDEGVIARIAKNTNPEKVIRMAVQNPDTGMLQQLIQTAKVHKVELPLARAIADHVAGQSDPMAYLLEHQAALKPAMDGLGKEHWNNLMTIAQADQLAKRFQAPKQLEVQQEMDPVKAKIGSSSTTLASMWYNPMQISALVRSTALGSRFLFTMRNKDIQRMKTVALFDPEVAAQLAPLLKEGAMSEMGTGAMVLTQKQQSALMKVLFVHAINGPVQALNGPVTMQSLTQWLEVRKKQQEAGARLKADAAARGKTVGQSPTAR